MISLKQALKLCCVDDIDLVYIRAAGSGRRDGQWWTGRNIREHFDMTILLIEHDMKLVSGICEELTVLNFGRVLCQGKTSDVLNNPEVIKAYLGE